MPFARMKKLEIERPLFATANKEEIKCQCGMDGEL
jgi:hypothetical protein